MYKQVFHLHADALRALAHPKRLEIIRLLRSKFLSVSEIYHMLDLPQANVSQHLMLLRDAGIVETNRDGKKVFYRVAHKNIIKACDLIREFLINKYQGTELADEFAKDMQELLPLVHDPVCKMRISPKTASFAHKYNKNMYYFCASGCLKVFKKDPEQYLK
ncbi:MAG: metalloregulator ArsR/SmtB family transcription factor [Patescibacteria group bacterium]